MHCKHVIATIPSYDVKSYRTFYGMHLSVGPKPFSVRSTVDDFIVCAMDCWNGARPNHTHVTGLSGNVPGKTCARSTIKTREGNIVKNKKNKKTDRGSSRAFRRQLVGNIVDYLLIIFVKCSDYTAGNKTSAPDQIFPSLCPLKASIMNFGGHDLFNQCR